MPLDNNLAERVLRGPAIGRRLSFGSDSEIGARFTAVMYSVVGTLSLNGFDVLRWLEAWLEACAKNAGRPAIYRTFGGQGNVDGATRACNGLGVAPVTLSPGCRIASLMAGGSAMRALGAVVMLFLAVYSTAVVGAQKLKGVGTVQRVHIQLFDDCLAGKTPQRIRGTFRIALRDDLRRLGVFLPCLLIASLRALP